MAEISKAQENETINYCDGWPGPAPVIPESEISAAYDADVVVVGAGHAGLACALSASEGGASVIVIEKKAKEKMTWIGEQIGTFNSKICTEQGYGNYDLDEVVDAVCEVYNHYVNRELVKKYVYNSGRVLDHYLSFIPEGSTILDPDQFNIQHGPEGTKYPIIRGGVKTWAGTVQFRGGIITTHGVPYRVNHFSRLPELLHWVEAETIRLGADWRYGHSAVVLTKENGRITGVIAKDPDGKYVKFRAKKGVLLGLGNFTDLGQKMALWAGGHIDNTPYEPMMGVMEARRLSFCFGNAGFIQLNNNAVRFHNEAAPFSNGISRQPDGIVSFVTDAKWLEQVRTSSLIHGNADFGRPEYFEQAAEDLKAAYGRDDRAEGYPVRNLGLTERETSVVYAADTLEELAGYLGYEGEQVAAFLKSIERYNELCKNGRDSDWGKDGECMIPIDSPPYYGGSITISGRKFEKLKSPVGMESGVQTDNDFRVVDSTCNPIPGLYAAGTLLGYYRSVMYYTPCGGNYIGSGMTHGTLIGEALAAE